MKNVILLALLVLLCGCATTKEEIITMTMREAAEGSWSWKKKDCDKSPQIYSFSEDGRFMFLYSEEGFVVSEDGDVEKTSTYRILDESDRVIRAVIDGEYRKTESGKTVVWDMVILNDNQFCWHRADWPSRACTAAMHRCSNGL